MTAIIHGGDPEGFARAYPQAQRPLIDLSTGINPYAWPLPPIAAEAFARLPSLAETAALEQLAAKTYGLHARAQAVAAPGTQILIELLPRLRLACKVAVLSPTYAEHAHCWRKLGHAVAECQSLKAAEGADIVVIVNPNNPDGRQFPRETLQALAARLQKRGGWLVVDEAFADFEDASCSLAPVLPKNALVLRSFGKTYGLAGVRLGFLLAHKPLADAMRAALGPWAVSGPALVIGQAALADASWRVSMQTQLATLIKMLDPWLKPFGSITGTHLFRCLNSPHAPLLYESLARRGLYLRRFADHRTLLRFGIPHDRNLVRVMLALEDAAKEIPL